MAGFNKGGQEIKQEKKSSNPLAARLGGGRVSKDSAAAAKVSKDAGKVSKDGNKLAILFGTTRVAKSSKIKGVAAKLDEKNNKNNNKKIKIKSKKYSAVRISNLAHGTTKQDIRVFLSSILLKKEKGGGDDDDIISCNVYDDDTNNSVYVDVLFKNEKNASNCIESINGAIADSRVLTACHLDNKQTIPQTQQKKKQQTKIQSIPPPPPPPQQHTIQPPLPEPILYSDLLLRKGRGFR